MFCHLSLKTLLKGFPRSRSFQLLWMSMCTPRHSSTLGEFSHCWLTYGPPFLFFYMSEGMWRHSWAMYESIHHSNQPLVPFPSNTGELSFSRHGLVRGRILDIFFICPSQGAFLEWGELWGAAGFWKGHGGSWGNTKRNTLEGESLRAVSAP